MKKYLYITSTIFLLLIFSTLFFTFIKINYEELNFIQKNISISVLEKWESKIEKIEVNKRAILDYHSLFNELNFIEKLFVKRIFKINPKEIGFLGPFYSKNKPDSLVKIESVKFYINDEEIETGVQYYPLHAYKDYEKMMIEMFNEIGKKLYIDSGYRSPGRQAYLFFKYLVKSNNFSLKENGRWIAMPGYSEHGSPLKTAIDFINEIGINGFSQNQTAEDFENLEEYDWLVKNGNKFNFHLSYPRNNNLGVAFEPWHWHWENVENKN